MFTHDPFQAYQTLGAIGQMSPYGLPGIQSPAYGPQAFGNPAIGQGYGQYPQQTQQWNPLTAGLINPLQQLQNPFQQMQHPLQHIAQGGLQNPLQQIGQWGQQNPLLQNPLLQNQLLQQVLQQQLLQHQLLQNPNLQNPMLNPMLAYQGGQQTPYGYPLAPQSFLGGGGIGQINPLQQLGYRQGVPGLSPFTGF